MAFRSDRQRRAAFFRMGAGAGPRQLGRRLGKRIERADSRHVAAAGSTAIGASMAPWVTHLDKAKYAGRGALRGTGAYLKTLVSQYPQLATYAAIPAAATLGTLAYERHRAGKDGRKKPSVKEIARRTGLAGAVGFGSWLGERSIVHSLPAFMNQPFVGRPMTNRLRAELLLGHGVPLAVGAGAIGVLAHRAARKRGHARELEAREVIKKAAPIGAGALLSHWFGTDPLVHRSGILANRPRLASLYYKGYNRAILNAAIPTYVAYRMLRRRRELEAQRRAA